MFILSFFFFNDTATTEIYTLSLHDALPISQKPRLQLRRHVADLVEKERAAFGLLEAPAPLLLRAGERTALMAEELRFQQVLGHRRGIDGDKRLGRARAMTVQRARHQLLAGA